LEEELLTRIEKMRIEGTGPTDKEKMLSDTLQTLRTQINEKDIKIKGLEDKIAYLSNLIQNKLATYHPGSNLKDKI
jgi:hypothetical protein